MREIIKQILADINAQSESADDGIVALATELAAGVSAEREAEISEALPVPYTLLDNATAQMDDEKIRVPRMVVATATKVNGAWTTSTQGRRMRRAKADCVVGVHTIADNEVCTLLRVVVLWRRARD